MAAALNLPFNDVAHVDLSRDGSVGLAATLGVGVLAAADGQAGAATTEQPVVAPR